MKILRGFVKGVVNKGTEQKPWALVGIECVSADRDGFEQTEIVKFMVAGQQYKDGLHNAYRQQIGAEVFAPYRDEADNYNGRLSVKYSLQGVPLRLVDAPVVDQHRPAPAAVNQPQKASA